MMLVPLLPFLVLACWVNGKRHIVAYVLVLLLFALWQKRVFSGLGLVLAGLGTVVGILAFSLFYQSYIRGISLVGSESAYENMRVDFGRDGALKMAIFAELEPSRARILEYRCQSIVFYLTFYLPRSAYPDKPWPYAVYLTSSALGLKAPRYLGWVVTTGWFDESIANFGWLGLLLGPSLFTLIARIGDGCQSELTRTLTIVVGSVLQVVHPWASSPIIALWILAVIMSRRSQWQRMRLEPVSGRATRWTTSLQSSRHPPGRPVDQNL